jgi:8-oxo-dGTP pyrophosphatase MutT (NUDIX family)
LRRAVLDTTVEHLRRALAQFPETGRAPTSARCFLAFLDSAPEVFERHHPAGHFTGSAWLVSADGERVLLTHHRKLDRWLQLGGHADGDADLRAVALREAGEESGLAGLAVASEVFDLDRHWIPVRGAEPGHWHYDVRYVVHAGADEDFAVSEESLALAWWDVKRLASEAGIDASLQRMARRWLASTASAPG